MLTLPKIQRDRYDRTGVSLNGKSPECKREFSAANIGCFGERLPGPCALWLVQDENCWIVIPVQEYHIFHVLYPDILQQNAVTLQPTSAEINLQSRKRMILNL
jgi:hypothetical protein